MTEPPKLLDEGQKNYLKTLQKNAVWQSILAVIADVAVPTYRPGKGDPHGQFYKWVYESGRVDDRNQVLLLLTNGQRGLIDRDEEQI